MSDDLDRQQNRIHVSAYGQDDDDDERHEEVGQIGAHRTALQSPHAMRRGNQSRDAALVEVTFIDGSDMLAVAHGADEVG